MPLLRFFMNRGISIEEAAEATTYFRGKTLQEGEFFLQPGEISNEVAFMVTGIMRQFIHREDFQEENILFINESRWALDRESFFEQIPSKTGIQAIENSAILTISYSDSLKILERYPAMAALRKTLRGEGIGYLEQREVWLEEKDLQKRYFGMRAMLGHIAKSIPSRYLCSFMQISPEDYAQISQSEIKRDELKFRH